MNKSFKISDSSKNSENLTFKNVETNSLKLANIKILESEASYNFKKLKRFEISLEISSEI